MHVIKLNVAREQLPPEEVMAYQKGQHLRNHDALLSERVRAEMVRLPPVLLEQLQTSDRESNVHFTHDMFIALKAAHATWQNKGGYLDLAPLSCLAVSGHMDIQR